MQMNQPQGGMDGFGFTPIGKIKTKRLRWLIDAVLPKGVLAFISAQPKASKSLLALYLALRLAAGRLFLDRFVTRRVSVLYISLEDHPGETKARARHLLQGRRFPRNLLMSNALAVSLPRDFDKIEADIRNSKADVVILDTLRRSHELEENSSTEMAPLCTRLRALVRLYNVTIIVIHHSGHTIASKDQPGAWLRGTSDYNAIWEVLIGLDRHGDTVEARVFHKYRSDTSFNYQMIRGKQFDTYIGDYPIIDLVDAASEQDAADGQAVLRILMADSISANQLEERLKGSVSRPRIDAALERLKRLGQVRQSGRGKNSKWSLIRPPSVVDGKGESST